MSTIKTLTYGMLRKTEQYENDRAEVTLELEASDIDFGSVIDRAKSLCEFALNRNTPADAAKVARKAKADKVKAVAASYGRCLGKLEIEEIIKAVEAA